MSFLSTNTPEGEFFTNEQQLTTYVRMCFQAGKTYLRIYDIVKWVNSVVGSDVMDTKNTASIINKMADIKCEQISGLYYLAHPEHNYTCTTFKKRLQGVMNTAFSEKIRSILEQAPDRMIKAAQTGERSPVIAELTEAEWNTPIIPRSVAAVMMNMYDVRVIMRSKVCMTEAIIEKLPPFQDVDTQPTYYRQQFFLVAEMNSGEDCTRHRIACQQSLEALPQLTVSVPHRETEGEQENTETEESVLDQATS